MNIVFVGPFGLQPKTTMSIRALPLAKALAEKGHTVTMLIPPWDDPDRAGQSWEDDGVWIENVNLPPDVPGLFHILLTQRLVVRALRSKPDVIHFFKPKAYAGLAHLSLWWLRRISGSSIRLAVDSDDWEQAWNERLPYSKSEKRFFAWQEKWGLRRADIVTAASRALEELAAQHRIEPGQAGVVYVPNGYRQSTPRKKPDSFKLTAGFVRKRWNLGKAPTILLYTRFWEFRVSRITTMVQVVAQRLPEARWLVVGQGANGQEHQLAKQLERAGVSEGLVNFTGWLPVDHLPAYFEAVDVAAFPYDDTCLNRTKCSVKLIDMMAAGLPVVADAVGQNCEYIRHNASGILVPAEDDVAFAQALIELLQTPEKRRRLGASAAQSIRDQFDYGQISLVVERAYCDKT